MTPKEEPQAIALAPSKGQGRKVRTPYGNAGANGPPPKGEEQWNRKNVRGSDLLAGNGRP